MINEIQNAMSPLIGKNIWGWGRAADLASFQFGERREVSTSSGKTKVVGAYALHIQCDWRITNADRIVVGHRDVYYPPGDEPLNQDFDWLSASINRRDALLNTIFSGGHLVVQSLDVGVAGYIRLVLERDFRLEVFPGDSVHHEHWRLFEPYKDSPHLIVTGKGIREEHDPASLPSQ